MAKSVVNEIIDLHRAQLQGIIEIRGVRRMRKSYEAARAEIEAKLAGLKRAGKGATFTAHQLRQVLVQINDGVAQFELTLRTHLNKEGAIAGAVAQRHLISSVKKLEKKFTGSAPVLKTQEASVLRGAFRDVEPSLLDRHARSSRLYGVPVVKKVKEALAQSMLMNETVDAAVDRVAARGGVFDGERWRAERIVRTELSYSYGVVQNRTMQTLAQEVPDLQRKLIETNDEREGEDSKILHGQVRAIGEPFVYDPPLGKKGYPPFLFPPGRPNDRAVLIPWRAGWTNTASTSPQADGAPAVEPRSPPA